MSEYIMSDDVDTDDDAEMEEALTQDEEDGEEEEDAADVSLCLLSNQDHLFRTTIVSCVTRSTVGLTRFFVVEIVSLCLYTCRFNLGSPYLL